MKIEIVNAVDNTLYLAVQRLIPQLSTTAKIPNIDELKAIVSSQACHLFIVKNSESEEIIGILTLALLRVPTGIRGWMEEIIVDANARGCGAGEALCRAAIEFAWASGAITIDLTSRPSRDTANRLYQKLGFKLR